MTLIRQKEIVVDMQNSTIMEKDAVGTLQAEGMARQNRGFAIIQVNNPQHSSNRVYSTEGISPALRDMGAGGNRQPKILQHVRNAEGETTHYNINDIAGTLKQPSGNQQNFVLEAQTEEPKGVAYRTHNYRNEPGHIIEREDTISNQLTTVPKDSMLLQNTRIRRLTPMECERLQSFPDTWTKYKMGNGVIKEVADTHRYGQLGNAVTVNVITAIGVALAREILLKNPPASTP